MVECRQASVPATAWREEHGDSAIGATAVLPFHMPDEPIVPVLRCFLALVQRLYGLVHDLLFQSLLNPAFGRLVANACHGAMMKPLPG